MDNSTRDYIYVTHDNEELKREDVFLRIRKLLRESGSQSIEEIYNHLQLGRDTVYGLINQLVIMNEITRIKEGRKRKYRLMDKCLLAEMFYPVKEIEKKYVGKIKGTIKRTQDQGANFTSRSTGHVSKFNPGMYDIIYD